MNKAVIFDIQRFSINDGPGIRTTIFFKGCGLRCQWCHNPESINSGIQLKHDQSKCVLCRRCIEHVSGRGIRIVDHKLQIDFKIHNRSFDLIKVCPNQCYSTYGDEYDISTVMDIVKKDLSYYEESEGGVTLSGGEALLQGSFIRELSKALHAENIHVCLDISGHDPDNRVAQTIDFVDLYLLDYKVSSLEDELKYCGHPLQFEQVITVLQNANKPVILRCPIIPTVNDTDEHFQKIAQLSHQYENIISTDILMYHNLTKAFKFKQRMPPIKFEKASEQQIQQYIEKFKKLKLKNGLFQNKII